ncbi:hypothetical protein AYO44_07710 [Planctomycetaceae bacterium SCGC AG-212-F19]|nr:hypothetical protein AYO44_07710 [Planctomycetaceae bacterium SCGC AG-212-F19]
MEVTVQLVIDPHGQVRCLYSEAIDLAALGSLSIARGSNVEPNDQGQWLADLSPVGGPCLGPFTKRSEALAAEQTWLEEHWLSPDRTLSQDLEKG